MDENSVKVEIFGQTYTINGDTSPEYILELAEYVHGKMEEISQGHRTYNPLQIAILAALNIADEYHQLKEMKVGMSGALEEKTRTLISLLDNGLIGDLIGRTGSLHS